MENITVNKNIEFPVALLSNKGILDFARDIRELSTCSKVAFKKRYFESLKIIDSNGVQFQVMSYLNKFSLKNWLLGKVTVKLFIEQTGDQLDENSFTELILKSLRTNEAFWESGASFNELEKAITNETSVKKIINTLANYYFKGIFN